MRTSRIFLVPRIALMAKMLIAATWLVPRFADAHAFPNSEQPMVGSTVKTSPPAVEIHFDNPVEAMFAHLQVTDPGGADVTDGAAALSSDGLTLSVKLKPLVAGKYSVKWSVVAEDSHRTEGSYAFTVAGSSD
jgi:copper resistance protein C